MTTLDDEVPGPVSIPVVESADQPPVSPDLAKLYQGFERELLVPLWTEIGELMPATPISRAEPYVWR